MLLLLQRVVLSIILVIQARLVPPVPPLETALNAPEFQDVSLFESCAPPWVDNILMKAPEIPLEKLTNALTFNLNTRQLLSVKMFGGLETAQSYQLFIGWHCSY